MYTAMFETEYWVQISECKYCAMAFGTQEKEQCWAESQGLFENWESILRFDQPRIQC